MRKPRQKAGWEYILFATCHLMEPHDYVRACFCYGSRQRILTWESRNLLVSDALSLANAWEFFARRARWPALAWRCRWVAENLRNAAMQLKVIQASMASATAAAMLNYEK